MLTLSSIIAVTKQQTALGEFLREMRLADVPRCTNGKPCGTDTVPVGRSCSGYEDGKCRHLSWLAGKPVLLAHPHQS